MAARANVGAERVDDIVAAMLAVSTGSEGNTDRYPAMGQGTSYSKLPTALAPDVQPAM